MSVSRSIHLVCDWPACPVEINTQLGGLARARVYAAEQGWINPAGLDVCPGHATAAAAHMPAVASAPSSRVLLSCSCSWEYDLPVDRVLVGNRWRMHLTGEVLPGKGGGPR